MRAVAQPVLSAHADAIVYNNCFDLCISTLSGARLLIKSFFGFIASSSIKIFLESVIIPSRTSSLRAASYFLKYVRKRVYPFDQLFVKAYDHLNTEDRTGM
jgi:hypothetical protein